jgi:hypothetical protein
MLLLLPFVALTAGCGVTRTLQIDSVPSGATVLLEGREVGTTPYSEVFLSYGVRRLELRLEGYTRDVTKIDVGRPWWQYFPASFFADLLWPQALVDEHFVAIELIPAGRVGAGFGEAQDAFAEYQALKRYLEGRDAAFHGHRPDSPDNPETDGESGPPPGR